tara:strand:+ start:5915 stop:6745 length:831 start_codon:yes stop_codon:yes gene_type:complete
MIKLERIRTQPTIHQKFRDQGRLDLSLKLMQDRRAELKDSDDKQKFPSKWGVVKDQLLEESNQKCAYCEAPTSVVAYGDVEHYRPKSKYWWLAYCYENYLASCQLCNQAYKGAKFSVKNAKMKSPVVVRKNSTDSFLEGRSSDLTPDSLSTANCAAFEGIHADERPYLVNPYIEDPAKWYAWEVDDTLRTVKLIPRDGVVDADRMVLAAEKDLGLNRKELLDLRYAELDKFRLFKKVFHENANTNSTLSQVQQMLNTMKSPAAPFSGMIRYFDAIL